MKQNYIDQAMLWWVWMLTKKADKYFGSISVGSACDNTTMKKYVSVSVRKRGVYLSPRAARLIAKQMTEWADRIDEEASA